MLLEIRLMTEITATDVQAEAITTGSMPIIVRDVGGNVLGQLVPYDEHFSPEEIAEALQRRSRPGQRFTTAEVLAHLKTLGSE